jgi:hypothetical protein
MEPLLENLAQLFGALWNLFYALLTATLPWTPLLAWVVFWLFGVNWEKLNRVLLSGGWIGLVLVGLVTILVWGVVAPPEGGMHSLPGLIVDNFVGKAVYVTMLITIMFLCGSVQRSGCCAQCCQFADEPGEPESPSAEH